MFNFSLAIGKIVEETDYDYIEAIVEYCNRTNLEIEVAATLISPALRSKIETIAFEKNLLKEKWARLPI